MTNAVLLNYTNNYVSNQGRDLEVMFTSVIDNNTMYQEKLRADRILEERRFISKAEAAEILGCSVRTIDRRITNEVIDIYQYEKGESGDTMIYKDKFFKKYGLI